MEYKEIVTIIGGFLMMWVTQYYQNKKNWKTIKDNQQDKKINFIFEYTNSLITVRQLKNKIRKEVAKIISTHHLDNSEMSAMLCNIRDKFISLIETIVETDVGDLDMADLQRDIIEASKKVRNETNWDKIDIPKPNGASIKKTTFEERLKNEVVIPNVRIYTQRLHEEVVEDAKKYNGTFAKISLSTMLALIDGSIRVYRDCKKRQG